MSIPTRVLLVLPLSLAFAGYFLRLPVKDKVAALKGVEFRRLRLDPEALGNDTPAFALLGLVYVNDPLVRLSGYPPKLSVPVTGPLEGTTLQGDGWSVTLNPGWLVRPAARAGSFAIVREN